MPLKLIQGKQISNSITGSFNISGSLNVVGNLNVIGTASFTYVTESIVQVGNSTIILNTNYPSTRFGGITVVDSGSFGNSSTGSMLWDSLNNRWVYANPAGSSYDGGMLISGPRNTSGLGNEQGTLDNYITKGQGGDHITSSMIYEDNSGNVGIGKTNPSVKLDVIGDIRSNGTFYGTTSQVNNIQTNGQNLSIKGVSTTLVTVDQTSGNVGIGKTTPNAKLDVNGNTIITGSLTTTSTITVSGTPTALIVNPTSAISDLSIINVGGNRAFFGYNGAGATQYTTIQAAGGKGIEFNVNNGTFGSGSAMIISPASNVGIGTIAPTGKLDVLGIATLSPSATVTAGDLVVDTANRTVYIGKQSNISGDNTLFVFRDRIGGIKSYWENSSSGNVSFGNFGTNYGVSIATSTLSSGVTTTARLVVDSGLSTFPSAVFTTGNVGIGKTNPSTALDVSGSVSVTGSLLVTGSTTVAGNIVPVTDITYDLGTTSKRFNNVRGFKSEFTYYYSPSSTESYFGSGTNNAINFPINNLVYGRFAATTGNFLLQNGGTTYVDDTVNRLQVSGSAKISHTAATPLIIERTNSVSNTNIQFKNDTTSLFIGQMANSNIGIGPSQNLVASSQLTVFTSTGNVVIQNGGTPVDTGYRLDTSGSARITNGLTVSGSLIVTGSTTVTGNIAPSANNIYDLGSSTNNFLRVRANNIVSNVGSLSIWVQHTSGAPEIARFHNNTGNLALQPSGSTFVDDGINRLQVSGSARITNGLTVTGSINVTGSVSINNVDIISTIVAMSIALA